MPARFRIENPALAGPLRQIEQLIRSRAATPSFKMEDTAGFTVQRPDKQAEPGNNHRDDAEAGPVTEQLDDDV